MDNIITIRGKVKYPITLDPGVWIFDDRRKDLNTYFDNQHEHEESYEDYTKKISKHWDREIMEGASYPPTLKTEIKFEKEKILTGNFCIPLKPFLKNAEVDSNAEYLVIETREEEIKIDFKKGEAMVLGFSKNGRPLRKDGPIHCYYHDGSNKDNPIKHVTAFRVE